jgi:dihydroflavonol-4-reductase
MSLRMRPTLVTGANGHVGNNICRSLVQRGEPVRAMIRSTADPAPLEGLDVHVVYGDILDPTDVARAVDGCGRVYHTAAGFLMWATDPEHAIIRPSVGGTRNIMKAAAKAGVEKVLYVSTGGTIGFSSTPDTRRTEADYNKAAHTPYFIGKIAAEREAFAIGEREKLPVTAINPGLILGPRFWKPSESTKQVLDFLNSNVPVYFDGGVGVVDVEDVATGALLAMDRGGDRERYIVSGENVTVKQLLDLVAEMAGISPPSYKLPVPVLRVIATGLEAVGRVTGWRPLIDRNQVDEFAGVYGYLDPGKAERELGFTWRNAREAVRRTVAWALDHGFVAEARQRALQPDPSLRGAY